MPRSRLGPLAIESKLGDHPSQSSVWRAVHVSLHRAVAVKVFSSPFGATPAARAELAREWESLKKLQHPAIAKCYGGGFEESDAYLAHELVEGETLAAQLERRGRLPWESVLEYAEPIIDAIAYLHGEGVIHGRLRPDKIIIAGLSPVLLDVRIDRFGSPFRSTHPERAADRALCPPECIDDPAVASTRSDLYAFGAILYLAITGRAPVDGETVEEVSAAVKDQSPPPVASLALECPVWLDKLIMQLLSKSPGERPVSAEAVQLALAEVRRRALSRSGVAEHTSAGFSPLNVNDQKERDEARNLLGQATLESSRAATDATPWHDRPWILISAMGLMLLGVAYLVWPLNEDQMRSRAEQMLAEGTRSSLSQAKISYLEPMLNRFPEGRHSEWAREQIEEVEMVQAEQALSVKLKRRLPLKNEAERLYAEAREFERFGDVATALDRYRSMETLLADDPQYRTFVNLARRQIATIERGDTPREDEAGQIIAEKLDQADRLIREGKVIPARKIWYSVIELYANNDSVAPLVARAQDRLAGTAANANPIIEERP